MSEFLKDLMVRIKEVGDRIGVLMREARPGSNEEVECFRLMAEYESLRQVYREESSRQLREGGLTQS